MACHFRYLSSLFKVIMQATLKKVSYLENSSVYIRNNTTDHHNKLPNNLNDLACFIFTFKSLQVNRLLLEKFPVLSLPVLHKFQQGGVDALKALKIVHEKGFFSCNSLLMIDEKKNR